jgi:aminoglycoside phosphotransferase (APT) family kinase protein
VTSTTESAAPEVDLSALCAWMDSIDLESGPIVRARLVGGGTQNVMMRFTRGASEFVLRRGPSHLRHSSNDSLRREIRLARALHGTDVPHPRLIAACEDESVLDGAVFYLMEPIDGFNVGTELPPLHASSPEIRFAMGMAVVDALATLSRVDYVAVGLADFGRPDGFLQRQVPRWLRELDSFSQLDNYADQGLPTARLADWLTSNMPTAAPARIMHGDFHIGNVMFDFGGPTVAALVDWEMCTIGDPLLDLGWLLATWPDPDSYDVIGTPLAQVGGLPSRDMLIRRYEQQAGLDAAAADWYTVLACFKLGIILEGSYARSCAGLAPIDVGRRLHTMAVALFDRGNELIGRA